MLSTKRPFPFDVLVGDLTMKKPKHNNVNNGSAENYYWTNLHSRSSTLSHRTVENCENFTDSSVNIQRMEVEADCRNGYVQLNDFDLKLSVTRDDGVHVNSINFQNSSILNAENNLRTNCVQSDKVSTQCSRCLAGEPGHIQHLLQ